MSMDIVRAQSLTFQKEMDPDTCTHSPPTSTTPGIGSAPMPRAGPTTHDRKHC